MTLLYFTLFVAGVLFTVVTSLFSGGDTGVEVHDGGGHIDVPIFSPTILAVFVTGFGGIGAILRMTTNLHVLVEVAIASVGGLLFSGAGLAILGFITRQTQGGSEYATGELVGGRAEVITPIPAGGLGEVSYVKKGSRSNAPARTRDGSAVPRNTDVRIVSVSGTTLVVELADSNRESV